MKLVAIILFVLVLFALAVIGGCGGGESEPVEPMERETVFDPMTEALDKAEAVQDLDLERKRRLDEQLEQN